MASDRHETIFLLAGDAFILLCSLWFALVIRNLELPQFGYYLQHVAIFVPICGISLLIFFIAGLYERQARLIKRVMGIRIAGAQLANTICAALLFFLLPLSIAPKTVLVLYFAVSVVLISVWRFFIAPKLSVGKRIRAVLVGTGPEFARLLEEVNQHKKYYVEFIAHLDTATTSPDEISTKILELQKQGMQLVVLDSRDKNLHAHLPDLYSLMLAGVTFSEFSSFYEGIYDRVPISHIDHAWLLECLPKSHLGYDLAKAALDRIGAAVGLIFALPFIGTAALILSIQGGSPFIFHERVGKRGKSFRIVKLRSMLFNDHGNPELQQKNRVTVFGRILRKTRIDELPQLINILRGELSFIGPRPELPQIAATYEKEIPYYDARHLITPGLSGWAQILDYDAPRGGADVERTRRKLSYDLYYLKHRSLGLDIVIALKTLRALAALSGV